MSHYSLFPPLQTKLLPRFVIKHYAPHLLSKIALQITTCSNVLTNTQLNSKLGCDSTILVLCSNKHTFGFKHLYEVNDIKRKKTQIRF